MIDRNIVEEGKKNVIVLDVFSKLIQERIVFIDGVINGALSNGVIAQLLYLDSVNNSPIKIYINTPGGEVVAGLAIYDVAKLLKSPIKTICIGEAASMGVILMLMGQERCGLKHSKFLVHQISSGTIGNLKEMEISVEFSKELQDNVFEIIKEKTKLEEISLFDKWFNSEKALECGIITQIL